MLGMGVGSGNTVGGLAMAASPPEAGDAGDEDVGDSTICNFLGPFSLSSEHSELGEAEEVAEVARRPRCQSLGLRMSNSAFFLRNCLSSGMTFGSGLLLLLLICSCVRVYTEPGC